MKLVAGGGEVAADTCACGTRRQTGCCYAGKLVRNIVIKH